MTDTSFHFTRNFFKLFYTQQKFLDSFAPEPLYLQTLAEFPNSSSPEVRRHLISALCKYIQHRRRQLALVPAAHLLSAFFADLDNCEQLILQDRREFQLRVDSLVKQSYYLRQITAVQHKIDATNERYAELLQNIANLRHTYNLDNVEQQLQLHYECVSRLIDSKLLQTAANMSASRDSVSSNGSQRYQQRVTDEVRRRQLSFRVPNDEVQMLRRQLFDSTDSLATKQRVSKQNIDMKVKVAKSQMKTISDLEISIADMQYKINQINSAKLRATEVLEQKRLDMSSVILDLVRLNSLIGTLNSEIAVKTAAFTAELKSLDADRERILNDPTLTEEERQQKLAEIDDQIDTLKAAHASDILLLEAHRSGLNLEMGNALRNEIDELEKIKVGKTSSECLLIDEQIRMLQAKLDAVPPDELVDSKYGKYYIGPNGEKIFRAHSLASEYMEIDGQLVKVRSAIRLLFDDTGDFYLDANGEKVYVQKYEVDELGRFYLDADGNKIYKASPYAAEFKLENGVLVQTTAVCPLLSDEQGDYVITADGKKVYLQKYEVNEIGRYYLDADGNRVYKANAWAAEFRMIDGLLVKVKSEMQLLFDDIGDYFVDAEGNKVYVQVYEMDEVGRYYLDADGNKIYKADPYAAEYRLIDGVLHLIKEAVERVGSQVCVPPVKTQFEYVKEYLGKALRRALAATIMHQPSDPINFIANHLLKQRHSELTSIVRQIEDQAIREERERVKFEEEQKKHTLVIDPCNPCAQYV